MKTPKFRITGHCEKHHWWSIDSPHKRAVNEGSVEMINMTVQRLIVEDVKLIMDDQLNILV